jgi:hypothetical protein
LRRLALTALVVLLALACSLATLCPAALAGRSTYGRLIAQGRLDAGVAKASFHGVRPARTYWLVVTNPNVAAISVTGALPTIAWSVSCSDPAHKASGGATGEATIARGRWVKRVRADWIKHPAHCSGKVEGLSASSSLKIRIYAD